MPSRTVLRAAGAAYRQSDLPNEVPASEDWSASYKNLPEAFAKRFVRMFRTERGEVRRFGQIKEIKETESASEKEEDRRKRSPGRLFQPLCEKVVHAEQNKEKRIPCGKDVCLPHRGAELEQRCSGCFTEERIVQRMTGKDTVLRRKDALFCNAGYKPKMHREIAVSDLSHPNAAVCMTVQNMRIQQAEKQDQYRNGPKEDRPFLPDPIRINFSVFPSYDIDR